MSLDKLEKNLHNWFGDVMKSKGITNYQINIVSANAVGEGFTSDISFFKVTGKDNNSGTIKEFHYVVKIGVNNPELRKKTALTQAYLIEMDFYNKIYPTFKAVQLKNNVVKPFNNVPKFVKSLFDNGIEYIILEDLKYDGFELHNKEEPMNLAHIKMLFETYGKFHALSLAVKHKDIKVFENITSNLEDIKKGFVVNGDLLPTIINIWNEAKSLFKEEDGVLEGYQKVIDRAPDALLNLIDPLDPHNVITHGDCWNNNFMFKYGPTGKSNPIDMVVLDWQVATIASPAYDLSYILYACASQDALDHTEELLEAYYETVSDMLKQLDCDPNEVFSHEEFVKNWKKYSIYGLLFTLYVLKLVFLQVDDAADLSDTAQGDAFKIMLASKGSPIYKERIKRSIRHYVKNIA